MNEQKLTSLFTSARKASAPVPPTGFAADVLRAVRREPATAAGGALSIFDQLNRLFPRLALVAASVIVLCLVVDFALTSAGLPEIGDGAAQASAQLLFDVEDL